MKKIAVLVVLGLASVLSLAQEAYTYGSIVAFAELNEGFEVLGSVFKEAGLSAQFRSDNDYTLLAPSDEAFTAVANTELTGMLTNQRATASFLNHYIIPARVTSQDIIDRAKADGRVFIRTVGGSTLDFRLNSAGQIVVNDTATVVMSDIATENGPIHIIDALIPLDTGSPATIPVPGLGQ